MQVKEIMTRDVEMVRPSATLVEAAALMKASNLGLLPVCEGLRVVGMFTDRDITTRAIAAGRDPRQTTVREIMVDGVISCQEDDDIDVAAEIMRQEQIRRLLIQNRNQEVVGIVSLGDLAVRSGDDDLVAAVLVGVSTPGPLRQGGTGTGFMEAACIMEPHPSAENPQAVEEANIRRGLPTHSATNKGE
jgi:CBS domain-containing protein